MHPWMRHARVADLDKYRPLVERIRSLPEIKEKTPTHFYYKGKNVIHFHTDGNQTYADIGSLRILVIENNYDKILDIVSAYMQSLS